MQKRWLNTIDNQTEKSYKQGSKSVSSSCINNIHKSHKNCASWIQKESSSSGEKTSHSCTVEMESGDHGHYCLRHKEPVAVLTSVRRSHGDNLVFSSHPNGLYNESLM